MAWPDFPLAFYPVAVVAILVTGIAKGGFGTGSGGLAVPLMSMFIAPPEAAGIMLPDPVRDGPLRRARVPQIAGRASTCARCCRARWSASALGALAFGALPVNAVRLLLGADRRDVRAQQLVRGDRAPRRAHGDAGPRSRAPSGAPSPDSRARSRTPAGRRSPSTCCRSGSTRRCSSARRSTFFLIVNYVKLVPYAFLGQLNAAQPDRRRSSSRRSRRSASGSAYGCTAGSPSGRSTT